MSSQTKQYIEMNDILSLRCDCKHCGASLSLPLANDLAKSLLNCPNCNKPWARLNGDTYELALNDFAKRVAELKMLSPLAGFKLYIEIAPELALG
jgi:hypothetical protein